jgi:hypothetical protein
VGDAGGNSRDAGGVSRQPLVHIAGGVISRLEEAAAECAEEEVRVVEVAVHAVGRKTSSQL